MVNELNKICTYDISEHPFSKLICSVVSNFLGNEIQNLSKLHNYIDQKSLPLLIHEIYKYFREEEFLTCYHKFCISSMKFHSFENSKYQAIPSLRIQYPMKQSVNFHNDCMYGHGQDVVNIWVPLVSVSDTKSMYVLDEADSISFQKSFKDNEWTISELNKACQPKAKPLKIDYGQYFIFHTWVLHGTKENITDETRVSFDVRILPNNGDYGLKDQSFFVKEPIVKPNTKQKQAAIYMHNYVGFTNNISTRYQSLLCQRYAENNNLRIYVEETEIRTVNHQPNLYDLCFGTYKGKFDSIILFSILLLPSNQTKRREYLQKVLDSDINLHFVLDDYIFNRNQSIDKTMAIYEKY